MKVSIKDLSVSMNLGNTGITLDVYDNQGQFLGDLRIGRATIEWCEGRTRAGNGVQKTWSNLIAFFAEPVQAAHRRPGRPPANQKVE
jgi:hypothetical protein